MEPDFTHNVRRPRHFTGGGLYEHKETGVRQSLPEGRAACNQAEAYRDPRTGEEINGTRDREAMTCLRCRAFLAARNMIVPAERPKIVHRVLPARPAPNASGNWIDRSEPKKGNRP